MDFKRITSLILVIFLLWGCSEKGNTKGGSDKESEEGLSMDNIRKPAVSGMWYPADSEALKAFLDSVFMETEDIPLEGDLWGLVSPHAGFVYSGGVAAHGFKLLARDVEKYREYTYVLIGACHRVASNSIAVWAEGGFRTPLGVVRVDEEVAQKLLDFDPVFKFDREPHIPEHSLEAEIPFLQYILGNNIKIVPILFGSQSSEHVDILTNALKKLDKEYKLIYIASSDMSHYHPYDVAVEMDRRAIGYTTALDTEALISGIRSGRVEYCGIGGVITLMNLAQAKPNSRAVLLKYANSGDVPIGEKARVVGYCAVAFAQIDDAGNQKSDSIESESEYSLTEEEKVYLLGLARRSIDGFVREGRILDEPVPDNPKLVEDGAVFVTLKENGDLRGCIGEMVATQPLYQSVISRAISAATRDPRFRPVIEDELENIEIEISVLSPLQKVSDYSRIEMGKHGVLVRKGNSSGTFLPQVATETGWDRDQFLRQLCSQKAGLSPDAYKNPDTELYVYTVVKFSENEFGLK
ncbi:AmmeMemoRadiSam system protein B [bacterium]|nr:AmmeMemoRadiSam system protein B [bacterium]